MPCYNPIKGFRTSTGVVFSELKRHGDIIGDISVPCGQCIGCRMRRASDWELRCMHEASLYEDNCFVTLTYARDKMPANGSLDHRDFQLFMKRLRARFSCKTVSRGIRFYMCGEYGPQTLRPHYHACLFNISFTDRVEAGKSKSGFLMYRSAVAESLWGLGRVTVQDLVPQTASYTARYIMKKALGNESRKYLDRVSPDGEVVRVAPEYSCMSRRPGIGSVWFDKFRGDVVRGDYVVSDGTKRIVPRSYDRLLKRDDPGRLEWNKFVREQRALEHSADNTPERLRVREAVHLAQVSTLTRGDSDELSE